MKDPFSKSESVEPQLEQLVARIQCGYYDRPDGEQDPLLHYEPEVVEWRNPDGTTVIHKIPSNVRGTPRGVRIEITNRYRGKYIGEGLLLADAKYITSADPSTLFEKFWVRCNPHRVRIQSQWKVSRVS